ncbi:hypothetical protein [Clostridium gasigenes]|uniref:hypothetical protein n=1 Tax=Clostridium gasigenes TaxID=94869 RepID=UPI001C0D5969|nr:hypothetical protein [Clostridium gasigenes]MBU3106701.1 hypothetical protein [Clostridium gasigenes]
MFVELNKENCYVQYLKNKEGVPIENKDAIIERTEELHCLLKSKMPVGYAKNR